MEKNSKYLLENLDFDLPLCYWEMYIENFFGEEKADDFYEYLINARQIMRKNDIRKIINHTSISVYSFSPKEQLAFVGIYNPINRNSHIIKNLENGFVKAQQLYRNKNIQLSKKIKKLGYSFTTAYGNWKDRTEMDTYQRERIFIIFSEGEKPEKFKNDICNLVKEYNINSVIITNELEDDKPKTKIVSKLFDVKTGNELKRFQDTTIEIVEKYFTDLHGTKFLFKIPYEKNKKVLCIEEEKKFWKEYYTTKKQELVRKADIHSFNMAMYKHALIDAFSNKNYNN